jgi:hypothetical protein
MYTFSPTDLDGQPSHVCQINAELELTDLTIVTLTYEVDPEVIYSDSFLDIWNGCICWCVTNHESLQGKVHMVHAGKPRGEILVLFENEQDAVLFKLED